MIRRLLIVLAAALIVVGCGGTAAEAEIGPDADPAAVPDLAGSYMVNGVDPLGTEYGGLLAVFTATDGYTMQWIVTGSVQEGSGTVAGNQLIVEWQTVESFAGPTSGTATYTITQDGVLYGSRTVTDYDAQGTETAYPNE
ncbi:MAG: hypothetical protein ACFB51_04335 [Anaerolineae bacterium]